MEHVLRLSVCLLAAASAEAQLQFTPVQCSMDSKGNRVCAGWVADANICGAFQFPGGGSHFNKLHCDDVIVQKLKPDGTTIYQRVFGGESDDIPYAFLFDAQDNVVVFGTTYSKQFPTTADAVQRTYAGPTPPTATSFMPLPSGGDVFVSILGPAGDLLYSTFLGSSGNDTLLGVWRAANGQANVLAVAGGSNFPIVPASTAALAGGPVPLAFDMDARKLLRSTYLPITLPDTAAAYTLTLQDDGTIQVATPGGLYTFTHDGVQRSFLSLESFGFAGVPVLASDSFGDLWVEGPNKVGRIVVAKLIAGTTEAFRWVLPSEGSSYVAVPFFGRAGLTYYAGAVEKLLATTSNALLTAPCTRYSPGLVFVLSSEGELKLLSYLPLPAERLAENADGSVSAVLTDQSRVPIDVSDRPKATCIMDAFDRPVGAPSYIGLGQVVRVRGGGFGTARLDGISVKVADLPAPVFLVAPGEVVFGIPFETPEGDAVPVSIRDRGFPAAPLPIRVRVVAPWPLDPIRNADGSPNSFTTPAAWGSTVSIFVTGAGPYSPPLAAGEPGPLDKSRRLQLPVSVSFSTTGLYPEPATVVYAGAAPGYIGVAQIDVQLPAARSISSIGGQLTIGSTFAALPTIWVR